MQLFNHIEEIVVKLGAFLKPVQFIVRLLHCSVFPPLGDVFFRSIGIYKVFPYILVSLHVVNQSDELLL